MCDALVTLISTSDKTITLLSAVAPSLLSSFSPYDVSSDSSHSSCSAALNKVTRLASRGLASKSDSDILASIVSQYSVTVPSNGSGIKRRKRSLLTGVTGVDYPVTAAVS